MGEFGIADIALLSHKDNKNKVLKQIFTTATQSDD